MKTIKSILILYFFLFINHSYGEIQNKWTGIIKDSKVERDTIVSEYKKGQYEVRFSSPCFNVFQINTDGFGIQSGAGYGGLAASLDYYLASNQFISLSLNGALTHDNPLFLFDLGGVKSGAYQIFSTSYLGLTNNHIFGKFIFGYGFSYSKERWYWQNFNNMFSLQQKERNSRAIGLMLPMNVMLGKSFFVGLIYRPTFIQFIPEMRTNFEYLLSFNFGWKYIKNKKPYE